MGRLTRLFNRKKESSKRVVIISSNGFAGVLNPVTCDDRVAKIVGETFAPPEFDGKPFPKLTELRAHLFNKMGLPLHGAATSSSESSQITYLAGILLFSHLKKAGFDPVIVNDFQEDSDILNRSLDDNLLAVAISTTFLPFREHIEPIVRFIRQRLLDVPIILGGPTVFLSKNLYISPTPEYDLETLRRLYLFHEPDRGIDYYIVDRRGEKTLINLLQALSEKREPSAVKNLGILTDDGVYFTAEEPEKFDVSDEDIDWDCIPDHFLKHSVSLRASAGCPFKCEFCNFHFYASTLLYRPMSSLVKELDQLSKRNQVKHISFVDDNFLINRKKVEDFCRTMIDHGYPFTWSSFIRSDSITDENIVRLADSGANLLMFGVESGDPSVLNNMNKISGTGHVLNVLNGLGKLGVSTSSSLVIGFPGETEETVEHTIRFLDHYRSSAASTHWFSPFIFILLPKTRVERHRAKYALEGFMLNWRHNTMDVTEAALQLKRLVLNVERVCYPISTEYPMASQVLGIPPEKAATLVLLLDRFRKNQIIARESGVQHHAEKNDAILREIVEIMTAE
jgi:anaerobic magnesium-protoporphyrin IX monomethyl ester cyclase